MIAERAEGEVHDAVFEKKRRPLELKLGLKRHFSLDATHAPAGDGRLDQNRPAEFLGPGRDVERVEGVGVHGTSGGDRLGLGGDVERAGGRVDDGRAGDADLGDTGRLCQGCVDRDGGDALPPG